MSDEAEKIKSDFEVRRMLTEAELNEAKNNAQSTTLPSIICPNCQSKGFTFDPFDRAADYQLTTATCNQCSHEFSVGVTKHYTFNQHPLDVQKK